jgi:transcriptional regulator with XRE-family HTH domain
VTVEDLLTPAPYEQPFGSEDRRRHLIGIRTQTASPVNEFVEHANRMIDVGDATEVRRSLRPGVRRVFVATSSDESLTEPLEAEQSNEPGAPSANILLTAATELSSWLSLTQQQVAKLVGMSPSTIMAWRRSPLTHPRHASIPTLLRLWAAVAGARDELGEAATLQLVWGSRGRKKRGAVTMRADDLAEKLLAAAETSSLAGLLDTVDYDHQEAIRPAAGQLAEDEETLSKDLNKYIADAGEPTAE